MADYNSLKATIDANIRANGVQAITGPVLNACLKAMITVLGNGYQLQGSIAQPGDDPSVPDARVAYVASGPGTYTDFGGVVIPDDGHAYMLTWDTQWTAVQLPVPTSAALAALATVVAGKQDQLTFDPSPISGSLNPVTSGGIFSAIEHAKGAAGLAEALLDTDSAGAEQEFSLRKSGGDGGAYFRRLLGNTKAFNQLWGKPNTQTKQQVTISYDNAEKCYVLNGTALAGDSFYLTDAFLVSGLPIGHQGLISTEVLGGSYTPGTAQNGFVYAVYTANTSASMQFLNSVGRKETIQTANGNTAAYPVITFYAGDVFNNLKVRVSCIDLTALPDNSATPEEFREKYPLLYYAYGRKLIHNKVAKVITKGANQWDEVWELGYWSDTGVKTYNNSRICSTNKTPVLPGKGYYVGCLSGDITYFLAEFDANGNFLRRYAAVTNAIVNISVDAYFITISLGPYGTTYKNDVCINLSDAEINGQYFPYWERELALDITNQEDTDGNKPFAGGVKSCPVASDEFNEVGGIVRVGVRPYQASDDTDASVITDGVDTAYALTTPVPFTWKEPLNTGIKVSKYGTEEITPAQTENIDNAPFRAVTTYSISVANLIAALSALGNRGGAKGSLGGNNPGNGEELTPEEETPKEEENPKEEETPVVEPIPEVQNKR